MKDYAKQVERQLNKTTQYKHLQKDPTATNNDLAYNLIKIFESRKLIQENTVEGLKINSLRTPRFYTQSKIHKEGNPGKPVISSVNCHTSQISEYVDYHLQPIAKQIPSYVKDASDFISKLKAVEPELSNSCQVSLDVKAFIQISPIMKK